MASAVSSTSPRRLGVPRGCALAGGLSLLLATAALILGFVPETRLRVVREDGSPIAGAYAACSYSGRRFNLVIVAVDGAAARELALARAKQYHGPPARPAGGLAMGHPRYRHSQG